MSAEKNNKEEDKRRTTKQGLFVVSPEQQRICTLLIDFGISESAAKELAERYEPAFVEAWLTYANQAENLHDPPAFVVSKLQTGKMPPEKRSKTRRNQYIEAKYAQYVEH